MRHARLKARWFRFVPLRTSVKAFGKKLQAEFRDHDLRGCGALVTIMILRKQGGGGQAGGGTVSHTQKRGWWTARGPGRLRPAPHWLRAGRAPERHRCIKAAGHRYPKTDE